MKTKRTAAATSMPQFSDGWVRIADDLPRRRQHYYYGTRYSEAVLAVVDGEVWWVLLAWDYDNEGWVQADLSEGPSPRRLRGRGQRARTGGICPSSRLRTDSPWTHAPTNTSTRTTGCGASRRTT